MVRVPSGRAVGLERIHSSPIRLKYFRASRDGTDLEVRDFGVAVPHDLISIVSAERDSIVLELDLSREWDGVRGRVPLPRDATPPRENEGYEENDEGENDGEDENDDLVVVCDDGRREEFRAPDPAGVRGADTRVAPHKINTCTPRSASVGLLALVDVKLTLLTWSRRENKS